MMHGAAYVGTEEKCVPPQILLAVIILEKNLDLLKNADLIPDRHSKLQLCIPQVTMKPLRS
jgi:hypothetical protein